MRTASRAVRSLAAGALAGAVLAVLAGAPAQAAVVTESVSERPAEVREYWTTARMRAARPAEELLAEVVGDVAGAPPAAARAAGPSRRAATQQPNNTSFPERTHGKVFFTIPGFGDFVCSGTVVRSPSHQLVSTAGHCVHEGDPNVGFATNFAFVPGFRDGQRPFGTWPATELATSSAWANHANIRFDVGFARLRRDGDHRGIQDVVGKRGIAFNRSRSQTYEAFGYPAQSPFNGQRLWSCVSPWEANDGMPPPPGPDPMRIDCDMTGGSSGGGWVVGNTVYSVISYGYEDCPIICPNDGDKLYGPYFGDVAQDVYRAIRGSQVTCQGKAVTQLGTGGDDVIRGGPKRDVIHGRGGDDLLVGLAGNDILCGGADEDRLRGKAGFDRCDGGPDRDRAGSCERKRRIP